jgi:RecA/RadA recombinase
MSVELVGNVPMVAWCPLGLYTVDHVAVADLNNIGVPLRSFIEIFGSPEGGKSTLGYYICGKVTGQGDVVVADLEANMNPEYALSCFNQSGMVGSLRVIDYVDKDYEPREHEDIMKELIKAMKDPEVGAVMLDSVGMVTTRTEKEATDYGTKRIGMRGQIMADFMRDTIAWLRATQRPKIQIGINHALQPIGGRGYITPGGDTKNYAANVRLRMYRLETMSEGSFCAEVKAEKLKYGGTHKDRKGLVFVIPNIGVSPEMTAMFDCFQLGLATRSTTVKMNGKSMGYLEKKFLDGAKNGKKEIFDPFFEALSIQEMEVSSYDEGDDE